MDVIFFFSIFGPTKLHENLFLLFNVPDAALPLVLLSHPSILRLSTLPRHPLFIRHN